MESRESLDKEWASGFRRRKFVLLEPTFAPFLLCEGIDVCLYVVMCEDMYVAWYTCGDRVSPLRSLQGHGVTGLVQKALYPLTHPRACRKLLPHPRNSILIML